MTRLNKDYWSPATPRVARDALPWVSSGVLTASAVAKNKPGLLGGIIVTATDAAGTVDVIVWDSPDSTLTGDERLCRITIPELTAKTWKEFHAPSGCGIQAEKGLYVQVVAGACEVIVYYK